MKEDHYFQRVYDVTCLIPEGRVSTYGAIADYLALGSARMVGWALNQLKEERAYVPAHRVVNRLGFLSGKAFFNPPSMMEEKLKLEGILVKDDTIVDFPKIFWHPRELERL
ncbi:MAG: MGMT family protein [Saprospiraceae bacterium]